MAIIKVKKAKKLIIEKYRLGLINKYAIEKLLLIYRGHKDGELVDTNIADICNDYDPIFIKKLKS